MKRKINVYVVGEQISYINGLPTSWDVHVVSNTSEAGLVLFTGGEDVSPHLYKHPAHLTTRWSQHRDDFEIKHFYSALSERKPMLGVCRGFQFLSVMSGSTLIQHSNQPGVHEVRCADNEVRRTNSAHHQIVLLNGNEVEAPQVLARVHTQYDVVKFDESKSEFTTINGRTGDIEMAKWSHSGSQIFGIQGHPEWDSMPKDFLSYFHDQLELWYFESTLN